MKAFDWLKRVGTAPSCFKIIYAFNYLEYVCKHFLQKLDAINSYFIPNSVMYLTRAAECT